MSIHLIQVLKVENEERTSKRTGNTFQHFAARCILLDETGNVENVGSIRSRAISAELRDLVRPGYFSAVFSLVVPDFGEDQGNIVSRLTGLAPISMEQFKKHVNRAAGGAAGSAAAPAA